MSVNNRLEAIVKQLQAQPVKGFLAEDEGRALFDAALSVAALAPCLEVGSYCGKSSVFLGVACRARNSFLYALDHHRGSEEHQLGEEYHDKDLYHVADEVIDSFPEFRRTLRRFELENVVIPVVTASAVAATAWSAPLSLVFIDGGHSPAMSMADCISWSKFVIPKGIMAVHDIFERPEEGGQGPFLAVQALLNSGEFTLEDKVMSLGLLRKKG